MIREKIEQASREAEEQFHQDVAASITGKRRPTGLAAHFESFAIAILTDPTVGYKEALELCHDWECDQLGCPSCMGTHQSGELDGDEPTPYPTVPCPCPCHTANAKLAELEEMSK